MVADNASFKLTKEYVRIAFSHLEETADLAHRNVFFEKYMIPDVKWTVTGMDHALAGTRGSVKEHSAATFDRIGRVLTGAISFKIVRVIVDPEESWACVETRGESTRKIGIPYNNEYVWLAHFGPDGKIFEMRSYFDTKLAETLLGDPDA